MAAIVTERRRHLLRAVRYCWCFSSFLLFLLQALSLVVGGAGEAAGNTCVDGDETDGSCPPLEQSDQQQQLLLQQRASSNWIQPLRHLSSYAFDKLFDYCFGGSGSGNDNAHKELDFGYDDDDNAAASASSCSDDSSSSSSSCLASVYFTSHPDRVSLAALAIWAYLIRKFSSYHSFSCPTASFSFPTNHVDGFFVRSNTTIPYLLLLRVR